MAFQAGFIRGLRWMPFLLLVPALLALIAVVEIAPSRQDDALLQQGNPAASGPPPQIIPVVISRGEFIPSSQRLKALREARLEVTAIDEEYWVDIPGVVGATQIPKGRTIKVVFTPTRLGELKLRNLNKDSPPAQLLVEACPPEAYVPNPVPASPPSVAAGAELYASNCVSCHGPTGRGDGPFIRRAGLRPIDFTQPFMANISDGELFWVITEGWQGMPTFKRKLTETERWNLVNYLRTLSSPSSGGKQ